MWEASHGVQNIFEIAAYMHNSMETLLSIYRNVVVFWLSDILLDVKKIVD